MSVVVKPMNTGSLILFTRIQLFEGQSRPLLSSQNLQVSEENKIECGIVVLCTHARTHALTAHTRTHTRAHARTHTMTVTRLLHRSSLTFTLLVHVPSLFNTILE